MKYAPAYKAILEAARKLELPKRHPDDLHVHDRDIIARRSKEAFAWVIGESGTYMAFKAPHSARAQLQRSSLESDACELFLSMQECVSVSADASLGAHWYVWDGRQLWPCKDAGEAWDTLRKCAVCRECSAEIPCDGTTLCARCALPRDTTPDHGFGDSPRHCE